MAWVKLHTDIIGDPKLMRAARKGARGLEWLPWLLAFAKAANDGGRLTVNGEPAEAVDLAAGLPGCSPARITAACESLRALGVLTADDNGALRFAAWERRAGAKPSDTPDQVRGRVQRHRERQRNANGNAECNALQGALRNAIEGEGEGEKETEGEVEPPAADASGARRVRPATPRPAPKPRGEAKYPHYPVATCSALYDIWTERRGPIDMGRFRKQTAPLFPSDSPPYAVEELAGALKLCLAVTKHRATVGRDGYEWRTLTPETWVGRIVEWVEHFRRVQADASHYDTLLPSARVPA